jgi:hypothetical protein
MIPLIHIKLMFNYDVHIIFPFFSCFIFLINSKFLVSSVMYALILVLHNKYSICSCSSFSFHCMILFCIVISSCLLEPCF